MERTRNRGIDLAKALAIFAVLMIHTASVSVESYGIFSADWWGVMFWGSLVRWAVPVFFMASGAVFLGRDVGMKDLFLKYILRIVVAFFVWAALYEVFDFFRGFHTGVTGVREAIKNLLTLNVHFHFYYLIMIVLVYLFMPVLRTLCVNLTKRRLEYALLLWAVTGILIPTVGAGEFSNLISRWYLPQTYAAMGYAVLGYYLKTYPPKKIAGAASFVCGFLFTFILTAAATGNAGGFTEKFWGGMTLGPCLMAAGVFSLCLGFEGECRTVRQLSKASFCVYLCHDFFNIILRHFSASPSVLCPWWSVPALSAVVLLASCVVYIVLRRIPWVKRWLV